MKAIPIVVFLLPLFVFFSCSYEGEKDADNLSEKTIKLSGKQQRDTVFLNFIIPQKTIRAQRTGKLERLTEGPEFQKNSLLVQFDNYDAFVELSGEKETLKEDITTLLNNLPDPLQPIEKKWHDFANKLTPDKTIPSFPKLEYKEEAGLIEEAGIEEKYKAIQKKELAVQNYFQLSKEDGFITKMHAHTDDYVRKNSLLISYHPKKIRVIAQTSFPLSKSVIKQIRTNLFMRVPVEQIKLISKSPTKITYSLVLNQKLNPKICPKYIIIHQDQNVFEVPGEFIGKDNAVLIEGEKDTVRAYYKNGKYVIYSPKTSLTVEKI